MQNLLTCEVGVLSATKKCCKRIPRYKATKQSIAARKQKSKSVGKAEEPSEARTNWGYACALCEFRGSSSALFTICVYPKAPYKMMRTYFRCWNVVYPFILVKSAKIHEIRLDHFTFPSIKEINSNIVCIFWRTYISRNAKRSDIYLGNELYYIDAL